MVKELVHNLLHLFYPRLCAGCNKPLMQAEDVLCLTCSLHIDKTEYHATTDNDTAMRLAGRVPFQRATSYAYFAPDSLLQHLLHGLKYRNKQQIGTYLGRQLANDLTETTWIKEIDLIIPVPLHPKKEAKRGYNQSSLIGNGISSILQIPVIEKALLRSRDTDSQTKKTRMERVDNMKEAFYVSPTHNLQNKHILLLDDVLTTGATLEACALALLLVTGVKISIATIGIV